MDPIHQLRTLVKELITKHKIEHKVIKKEVYSAIKELSDELPPIKVLYNTTYGGFGYSSHFMSYLETMNAKSWDVRSNRETRVHNVAYIEGFGKQCKDAHPFVARLIALHTPNQENFATPSLSFGYRGVFEL